MNQEHKLPNDLHLIHPADALILLWNNRACWICAEQARAKEGETPAASGCDHREPLVDLAELEGQRVAQARFQADLVNLSRLRKPARGERPAGRAAAYGGRHE